MQKILIKNRTFISFACLNVYLCLLWNILQGGNFLKEYNPASLKLRRRPFMTLSVSVVGKYIDDVEDHADKGDSELYQVDPDDPNILSMELDPEVR